jgi:hypothetical protein
MLGYLTGLVLMVFIVFAPYNFENNGPASWNKFEKVVFLAFEHIIFSIGLSLWIIPMINGFGGIFKDFLASKTMIIIARISVSFYLINPIVILYSSMNVYQGIYYEDSFLIYRWPGTVFLSCLVAILLKLLIESPLLSLKKKLLFKSL